MLRKLFLVFALASSPALANPDQGPLYEYLTKMDGLLASQKRQKLKVTNYNGWSAFPYLHVRLDLYELERDTKWLDEFVSASGDFIDFRGNVKNVTDFTGEPKAQWYRPGSSDIFDTYPPQRGKYGDLSEAERKALIAERGWKSLRFSDINNDGLFLHPMMRFAVMVQKDPNLAAYRPHAERLIQAARETVASHEGEWIQTAPDKGHYIFGRNSPFFLDGVEMPINEAAPFGTALTLLYEASGDSQYLDRAKAMVNNWLDYVSYDGGRMYQPYTTGNWLEGWTEANSPSVNQPSAPANQNPEVFKKASLTVSFLVQLTRHSDDPRYARYLDGFRELLAASYSVPGNQLAFFPQTLDLKPPKDSHHVENPASFRGMLEIAEPNTWRRMYLMSVAEAEASHFKVTTLITTLLYRPETIDAPPAIRTSSLQISPYKIGETPKPGCLYKPEADTAVLLTFKRAIPKHERLYLTTGEGIRGIRLQNGKDGIHRGSTFLRAGDCVNWQWSLVGKPKTSEPTHPGENKIDLVLYTLADSP